MNDFANTLQPSGVNWNNPGQPDYGMVTFGQDKNQNVMFYTRPVRNEQASRDANRPVFENIDYVIMHHPGEANTQKIDRPARQEDKERFPRQWNNYVHKRTQVPEGTPVDILFPNSPAIAETCKACGVFTIEQLRSISAHGLATLGMGGQEWQNRAKQFLDSANNGEAFHKLQRENDGLKQEIRLLQRNYENLQAQLSMLMQVQSNSNAASKQPDWQPGYDAQAERLNSNHPSQELAKYKKKNKKQPIPVDEIPAMDEPKEY